MTTRTIEARARLTATDDTGRAFASVAKRINDVAKASAAYSKSGVAQLSPMAKALDALNGKARDAVAFREASKQLGSYRIEMVRAAQEAARLKSAMDAAGNPTRSMQRDFDRASKAADAARASFMAHGQATRQMRQGLEAAGIPIRNLAAAQADLERKIKSTSAAMQRQATLQANLAKRTPAPEYKPTPEHKVPAHLQNVPPGRQLPVGEGVGVIAGVQAVIAAARSGMDVDTERSQARQAGWTEAEIKRAEGEANRYSAEYGVAPGSALNILREARPTFGGDLDQTLASVPDFFKVLTAMRQKMPGASDSDHNQSLGELIKAGEILGYSGDPAKLREYADFMTKMTQVHGSALRPGEVLNFAKRAKSAGSSVDMDFLKSTFPTMLPEIGGDGLGTANMTLRQALVGGKMKKRAAENLADLGLINRDGLIQTDDKDVKGVKANAIIGRELAERNPLAWVEKHLIPAMDNKGYAPEQRSGLISTLFSDRNAEHMINMMVTQRERLAKDRAVVEKAQGLDGVMQSLRDDPYLAAKRVSGGMANAGAAVSTPFMEGLKTAADAAATSLNTVAETARNDPTLSAAGTAGGVAAGVGLAARMMPSAHWVARALGFAAGGAAGGVVGGLTLPYLLQNDPRMKRRAEAAHVVGAEELERSSRAQRERNAQPEAARGREMMRLGRMLDEAARVDSLPFAQRQSIMAGAMPSNLVPGSRFSLGNDFKMPDIKDLKATVDQPVPVTVAPVKLEGHGTVSVTIKVQGEGRVTGVSTTSSGHIKTDAGWAMPEFPGATD